MNAANEALAHGRDDSWAQSAQITAGATDRAHDSRRTEGIETTLPTFTAKRTT